MTTIAEPCSGAPPVSGESPEYVQTSLAAAMTLGLKSGRFHRGARLGCLNLLLTYANGCIGRCSYCGLARDRSVREGRRTFIRVGWPTYPLTAVLARARERRERLKRVCVSLVTHTRAPEDAKRIIRAVRETTEIPVSALIAPTLVRSSRDLDEIRASGADMVGIAVDAATEALFAHHRGAGVNGPHRWERYWQVVEEGVRVFGAQKVSVHLIVGLGETEQEMMQTLQRVHDLGAIPHLFSFFPECGSALDGLAQPPVGQYRRVQLARRLIRDGAVRVERLDFDPAGRILDFGAVVGPILAEGTAFMTSGCPGPDGETACNRPYGNERPGGTLYNFPFRPDSEDLRGVARELEQGTENSCEGCAGC